MALQQGVAHPADQRVRRQKLDHFGRVLHVPGHAQRQGLDALQNQPSGVRAHAGTKVAQALAPGAQQEGTHGALFTEDHVVKAFIGLAQFGKLARFVPVKAAAIDHHAAHHRAVARQELGGRVVDQIGPVVKGLDQPGRGEGGIDQQRHARFVRDGAHGLDVQHVHAGVAHGFAKKEFGVGLHRGPPGVQIAGFDKGGADAKAAQGVVQQVV